MKEILVVILNIVWFGFFFVAILKFGWTPWSLAVPILIHWNLKDLSL